MRWYGPVTFLTDWTGEARGQVTCMGMHGSSPSAIMRD